MGLMALQRLMFLQRNRQQRRRQQISVSTASENKRKGSPCQRDGDGDSQAVKIMRSSNPELPEVVNTQMLPTKFLYLKHLTIHMRSGVSFSPVYDYFSLVSFLEASPSLETLTLNVMRMLISQHSMKHESVFEDSSHFRQIPEHCHSRLKNVKILGFSTAKSLIELTCYILNNAVSLERLTLNTVYGFRCSDEGCKGCYPMNNDILDEAPRAAMAIRTYIQDKVPSTVKLTVLGPCRKCHRRTYGHQKML